MMIDPLMALFSGSALVGILALLFWPQTGWVWRWRKSQSLTARVLLEDALKHLYHQEYKNRAATLESLSGALHIPQDQAAGLLAHLEQLELVKAQASSFALIGEGRSYALRIIRMHRLWERYLADETGLAETQWHEEAERREHYTTPEQAEVLATQMGNPVHDPHGDPIPTAAGELPPPQGLPLTDFPIGVAGRITHIEDEPETLYAQLVAQGLYPGMYMRVISKSSDRIQCVAEGEEIKLAPVVAANVTVVPLPAAKEGELSHETLASLRVGEAAVVMGISRACRALQRRRLLDLGLVPGTLIAAELTSMSGNPTAYNIRGATIALRKDQANLVHIRRQEGKL
ncbi:MAG: iron dependent repressor, metal binding and dimerization domain protein [bacterium]